MMTSATLLAAALGASCGSDEPGELFPAKPECQGVAVEAFAGAHPQVLSTLEIGAPEDGFDLDRDGKPDNKLGSVADIARQPIADALANYEVIIPIEFFDLDSVAEDTCVKFGLYLGAFAEDTDTDGKRPSVENGDCNDNDRTIHRDAAEVAGDFKDNNCNGLADETGDTPSNDTMDRDGDQQSIMDGDCDDTNPLVKKGAVEICNDGLDNDCDGVADRTGGATTTACNPFDGANPIDIPIDPLSLDGNLPIIAFKDGVITKTASGYQLDAGPSVFSVAIPVYDGVALELKITGATIQADIMEANGGIVLANGRLGGVLDAKTADTIRGLTVDQIGLTPENSLLDATFANILGTLLSLPKAKPEIVQKYDNCRTPDIDVDQDGLEAFCDSDGDADDDKSVDVCIDGDGTEVMDVLDSAGKPTMHCTEAMKGDKPRFVDGISVALKFSTSRVKSLQRP